MPWGWFERDSDELATSTIHVLVAYSNDSAALSRFQSEARRHVREVPFYPTTTLGVIPTFSRWPIEPSSNPRFRYRTAVFGRPFRPLNLGRLRSWVSRLVAPREVAIVAADTGASSHPGLVLSIADDPGAGLGVADGLGSLGEGLIEGTRDVASGAGELARGVGDTAEGVGDAARSLGEGLRDIGSATRAAPTISTGIILLSALVIFAVSSGALRFAPVKIG